MLTLLLFLCRTSHAQQPAQQEISIDMGIYIGGFNKYPQYMVSDYCSRLPDLATEQIDRILAEVIIICEAMAIEKASINITFVPIPNDARGLKMLEQGNLDALTSSLWPFQYESNDVLVSSPSIRKGEFEKGIYVSSKNQSLLQLPTDKIDLKTLTGLTISDWKHDVAVMQSLTQNVVLIEYNPAVFKLLEAKRADFVLLEFAATSTFQICQGEYCIYPLQGIKVAIYDTRHFVASNTSKQGARYFNLLNSGLKKLRKQGRIREIYEEMGFLNPKVKNWKVINQQ